MGSDSDIVVEECCGNCNICELVDNCLYNTSPLTLEEYRMSRSLDTQISRDNEHKPMNMESYLRNRLDKEAYVRERNRRIDRVRYWRNPEKFRQKALRRYYNNRDSKLSKAREYYEENKEELKLKSKEYYESNKDDINKKRSEKRDTMIKELEDMWRGMKKGVFTMSDGTVVNALVIKQKSMKPSNNLYQFISQIIDPMHTPVSYNNTGVLLPFRYIFEEFDFNRNKLVRRYTTIDTIHKKYPWFLEDSEGDK